MVEDLVDAPGQLHPLVERHGRAGDVGELLGFRPRVALEARNQLEDFFGAHARAAARGDSAAGCDEAYTWEVVVGPGIDAAYGPQDEASDNERKDVGFRALNYTVFTRSRCWCWCARSSHVLRLVAASSAVSP